MQLPYISHTNNIFSSCSTNCLNFFNAAWTGSTDSISTLTSLHLSLTCGEEDKDNCDDDDPEPDVVAEEGVTAAVWTAGAAVIAGVAERSVVVASHIFSLLSVHILWGFQKEVNLLNPTLSSTAKKRKSFSFLGYFFWLNYWIVKLFWYNILYRYSVKGIMTWKKSFI